jgi:hypothetical protein
VIAKQSSSIQTKVFHKNECNSKDELKMASKILLSLFLLLLSIKFLMSQDDGADDAGDNGDGDAVNELLVPSDPSDPSDTLDPSTTSDPSTSSDPSTTSVLSDPSDTLDLSIPSFSKGPRGPGGPGGPGGPRGPKTSPKRKGGAELPVVKDVIVGGNGGGGGASITININIIMNNKTSQ